MKKQFAEFGAIMSKAREAMAVIWREQQREIGIVNEEHKAMHEAFQQKEASVADVIKDFELLDEDLDCDVLLAEQQKAMREIECLNEVLEITWGDDLDVHEEKIAAINAKYERMYQKTMKKAGYKFDSEAK